MHDEDIIHRDIKPSNLVFARKGDLKSLKIIDYGLATYMNVEKYSNLPKIII